MLSAYIRFVALQDSNAVDDSKSAKSKAMEYRRLVRLVLPIVPQNRLQHLTVSGVRLDRITLRAIIDQQTVLRELALGRLAPDATKADPLDLEHKLFTNLTSLVIPSMLADGSELEFYSTVIETSTSLKHLTLGASLQSRGSGFSRSLLGQAESNALFGGMARPLGLASLYLHGHSLRERGPELVKRIDFEGLEQLRICLCAGMNVLFDAMSDLFEASSANVRLKSIIIDITTCDGVLQTITALMSLQRLLRSFVGLEVLQIRSDIDPDERLDLWDVSCLANHYPTLQV